MASPLFRRYGYLKWLFIVLLVSGCTSVKYIPRITTQKSIPDVSVIVSYKADGIYQVNVNSKLSGTISLLWNSSAYVNTGGVAVRLIHIPDLDNFPDHAPTEQTPSSIARGVGFISYFVGESWIDYARRGVTPRPKDSENKARIYLAFNIKGKKVYWKGEVIFVPVK